MTLPLIIRPAAEADLADAKDWYDGRREGLGDEFLLCVEEALGRLTRAPEAHAVLKKGVRRALVRRFPYGIFYRVEADHIAVLAVFHNRRDPRHWQARA
jgi:plasmid stabilization system protein ParE